MLWEQDDELWRESVAINLDATFELIGLVRAAAIDLASYNTTCNAVCPGWVRTEIAEASALVHAQRTGMDVEEVWAQRASSYPAGRVVSVEEVTAAITFLASPASERYQWRGPESRARSRMVEVSTSPQS